MQHGAGAGSLRLALPGFRAPGLPASLQDGPVCPIPTSPPSPAVTSSKAATRHQAPRGAKLPQVCQSRNISWAQHGPEAVPALQSSPLLWGSITRAHRASLAPALRTVGCSWVWSLPRPYRPRAAGTPVKPRPLSGPPLPLSPRTVANSFKISSLSHSLG